LDKLDISVLINVTMTALCQQFVRTEGEDDTHTESASQCDLEKSLNTQLWWVDPAGGVSHVSTTIPQCRTCKQWQCADHLQHRHNTDTQETSHSSVIQLTVTITLQEGRDNDSVPTIYSTDYSTDTTQSLSLFY